MNWHETETRAQILLSVIIMICCLVATYIVFSMNRRENELMQQVRALSTMNDIQAKVAEHQFETCRVQGETNRNLSKEINDIRQRQDLLKRVADRIGVSSNGGPEIQKP